MVVWLVVCGFRSQGWGFRFREFRFRGVKGNGELPPRANPSNKATSSCRQRGMESYFLGRSPRIRPSQAARNRGVEGYFNPRAEPSHKAIPNCKEPTCASREHIVLCGHPNSRHPRTVRSTGSEMSFETFLIRMKKYPC